MKFEVNKKRAVNESVKTDQVTIDRADFEEMKRQLKNLSNPQVKKQKNNPFDRNYGYGTLIVLFCLMAAATINWDSPFSGNAPQTSEKKHDYVTERRISNIIWGENNEGTLKSEEYQRNHPEAAAEVKRLRDAGQYYAVSTLEASYVRLQEIETANQKK